MADLPVVRVGGVPEHFNFAWHLAAERGLFEKNGVKVQWVDQPLGTGQMITSLKEDKADLVIALTEGLVADIAKGSDIRIISTYVESPLCWAISTGKNSPFNSVEDLKGQKFGVSRLTSGSHLMAFVLAMQRGWNPQTDISFEIKGSFENLRNSVNDGSTAAFMWETFTTKPYHDTGEVKRIGDITTPWSCFMIAGRQSVLDAKFDAISRVLATVRDACEIFHVSEQSESPSRIAQRYGLKPEDAKAWFDGVKISATRKVSEAGIERALSILHQVGVIPTADIPLKNLIDSRFVDLSIDIHSMKLYNKPELVMRTYRELQALGMSRGKISYTDLVPVDQRHHYHGTDAVDQCISRLSINADSNVISLGSGLGGPARWISGRTNATVLAVELQHSLHETAVELTKRCSLDSKVHHIPGDFLQLSQHLRPASYDAIVSWLTVLHIPEREKLFKQSFDLLKPNGYFYAEDFVELSTPLTDEEKQRLAKDVFCPYVPNLETYKKQVESSGLKVVEVVDLTEDWKQYAHDRVEKFKSHKDSFVNLHGEEIYKSLLYFYQTVADLYSGRHLGGLRIVAQKK